MRKTFGLILAASAFLAAAPLSAQPRGDEPVAVPRTIKQGIDFVYVDPEMSTVARRRQRPQNWLSRTFGRRQGQSEPHSVFFALQDGLERYRETWGAMPTVKVPAGPALKPGATGKRVMALRNRLGLVPSGSYDGALTQRVTEFQRVHGLGRPDGIAGSATIAALNRGAVWYERRIAINMERAYRLPQTRVFDRYVVVDAGSAEAWLFERDRAEDRMRVVVGMPKSKTPMMAVLMRNAKANPYWNVPPDLIASLTAKNVREKGLGYFNEFHYEVLSDWGPNARAVDPKTINWAQVAAAKGKSPILVRQLPGPWNSMGAMKFEMRNDFGIYLHDTPHKELFAQADRWKSNGCVRLEDWQRFASWVFGGRMPRAATATEQRIDLPRPVPIYLTYLTVDAGSDGVTFRADPYGLDTLAMPQMFGGGPSTLS
jgi:murein L,D-transpeptidase YcbB/YkuD